MSNQLSKEDLKSIINEVDPIGLVDIDTPESWDEYKPEVDKIFELLDFGQSEEDLSNLIYNIFVEYFNEETAGDKNKYQSIAKIIKKKSS